MISNQKLLLKLAKQAVDQWGEQKQVDHMHEEIGELMVALNHHKRGRVNADAVREEIADVLIMCFEMAVMYNPKKVSKVIDKKLRLVKKRLDQPKKVF